MTKPKNKLPKRTCKHGCSRDEYAGTGYCFSHCRVCRCGNRMSYNAGQCKPCANEKLKGERYEAKQAAKGKNHGTPKKNFRDDLLGVIGVYEAALDSPRFEFVELAQARLAELRKLI